MRAKKENISSIPAFVTQNFEPFIIHLSHFNSAFVCKLKLPEPASVSVSSKTAIFYPEVSKGKIFLFYSSEPPIKIAFVTIY